MAATFLVGSGLYVALYYVSCSPSGGIINANGKWYRAPRYTPDFQLMEVVFAPVHVLDRRIRPDTWASNIEKSVVPPDEQRAGTQPMLPSDPYDHDLESRTRTYFNRDVEDAMEQLNAAIKLTPHHAAAYLKRGTLHQEIGNWQAALEDYEMARERAPDDYAAWNHLAMLLAACPVDELRNGAQAVEYAQKACELTEWNSPAAWNTLAVAYAELGDWQAATDICDTQLGQLEDGSIADEFRLLRELFVREKPYRLSSAEN